MTIADGEAVDAGGDELDALLGDGEGLGTPDPFEIAESAETPGEVEAGAPDAADGEGAPANGPPKTVPYKRLQQVVKERNEIRARMQELEAKESELRAELSGAQEFRSTFSQRYGKFRNPVAQLALDADFMSTMEDLAKSDPQVGEFYKKVMASMGQQSSTPTIDEPVVKPDSRLDRVIERYAEVTIKDVLAPLNLQDRYQKMLQNHVLQNAKDLATLDASAVKTLARQFITDSGFTLEEMRKVKDTTVAQPKPKTGRQGAGAPGAPKSSAAAAKEPKKFANREEYLNHRAGVVENLIAELMVPSE